MISPVCPDNVSPAGGIGNRHSRRQLCHLHVARIVSAPALEAYHVIDNIAGTRAGRLAGGPTRVCALERSPQGWVALDAIVGVSQNRTGRGEN